MIIFLENVNYLKISYQNEIKEPCTDIYFIIVL